MCKMVQYFRLPEQDFNKFVIDNLKAKAGTLITIGYDYAVVDQGLKETAVALSIARKKFLKKYHF